MLDAHGDHRLAMLGAVAGLASREGVEVDGMEAAAVSYPGFADDLAALRGSSLGQRRQWRPPSNLRRVIIAIDGPAGGGKCRARKVAERLGFTYLDTGAMYRAVALAAAGREDDAAAVAEAADIRLGDRVLLDGRDVTDGDPHAGGDARPPRTCARIRRCARRSCGSSASSWPTATGWRRAATSARWSCPDAEVKVFLTATPEAARAGAPSRSARTTRPCSPTRPSATAATASGSTRRSPAPDAVPVDTSELDLDVLGDRALVAKRGDAL